MDYILQKDLPGLPAGSIFTLDSDGKTYFGSLRLKENENFTAYYKRIHQFSFEKDFVENNPHWFVKEEYDLDVAWFFRENFYKMEKEEIVREIFKICEETLNEKYDAIDFLIKINNLRDKYDSIKDKLLNDNMNVKNRHL